MLVFLIFVIILIGSDIMPKKSILLDVDEVICFAGYLDAANKFMNTNYKIEDINTYYIEDALIPQDKIKEYNSFINNINFYENPFILPNAIEVIKRLNEYYDIYICSSCVMHINIKDSGKQFKDKYDFLIKTLPFLKPENFIFTNAKNIIKADIQIDDKISNLEGDISIKILFPSYHNKNISKEELKNKNVIKAGDDWKYAWKEIEKILLRGK